MSKIWIFQENLKLNLGYIYEIRFITVFFMIIKSHSQNMDGFKIRLSEARARSEGIFADCTLKI